MVKNEYKETQGNNIETQNSQTTAESLLVDAEGDIKDDTEKDAEIDTDKSIKKSTESDLEKGVSDNSRRNGKGKSNVVKRAGITEVSKVNAVVKELAITDVGKKKSKAKKLDEEKIEVEQVEIEKVEIKKLEDIRKRGKSKVQTETTNDISKTSKREAIDFVDTKITKARKRTEDITKEEVNIAVEAESEAKVEAKAEIEPETKIEVIEVTKAETEGGVEKTSKPSADTRQVNNYKQANDNKQARKRDKEEKSETKKNLKDKSKEVLADKKAKDKVSKDDDKEKIGAASLVQLLVGISIVVCITVYVAIAMYFADVFFDNTFINGHDFSRRPPSDMVYYIDRDARNYTIEVYDNSGVSEIIKGPEIGFALSDNGQTAQLFYEQNPWTWPIMIFRENHYEIELEIGYCETRLFDRVAELAFTNEQAMAEPMDAEIAFDGERFYVQEEVMGAVVDGVIFTRHVEGAVALGKSTINVDDFDVRVKPSITSDKQEMIDAVDMLNHFLGASITYDLNPKQVVVDANQIIDWISYDEDFSVTFHEYRAREFMSNFIATYSTYGTVRTFINPLGMEAQVSSWGFGWLLDEDTEVEAFLSDIRNGEVAYREPAHFRRGTFYEAGEWGDTFIQVDLTSQHMWFFNNGELVLESPVVTGMAGRSPTPAGVFDIQVMLSPTILIGPRDPETGEYAWREPVSYWMQITWSGIGFHDATWQPYFGGARWTYGGSQGCINMPLDKAGQLYRMVTNGTRVIIHY